MTKKDANIPVLVLTGGPCAGKTTALCYLEEKLRDYGFTVLIINEVATSLILAGAFPAENRLTVPVFEEFLFEDQLARERFFHSIAREMKSEKTVILCDRGIMDIQAYSTKKEFDNWLWNHGLSRIEARDRKYDGVFHLRSAACGAENFYTRANNKARFESADEARLNDEKTLAVWMGHPHLRVIDNSTNFESKLKRLLQEVCHSLGIPVPLEIERKFLLDSELPKSLPVPCQMIEIEQAYLNSTSYDVEKRVRKRTQDGKDVFYKTEKHTVIERHGGAKIRAEREWHITEKEYYRALAYRNPKASIIRKQRICFVWEEQYFELDVFSGELEGLVMLEIELTNEDQDVKIPAFLNMAKEVTNDPSYTNKELALKPKAP